MDRVATTTVGSNGDGADALMLIEVIGPILEAGDGHAINVAERLSGRNMDKRCVVQIGLA
jgi:hypothetical protein